MTAQTHRKLLNPMTAYRIGEPHGAHPIYSAEGARRVAGRWHRRGQLVIYASQNYSTAMLEKLAHYSGALPRSQCFIDIAIPAGVSYECVTTDSLPAWDHKDGAAARKFGSAWIETKRSAILIVPSVVARMETNLLINPAHPETARITHGLETPVRWDTRLFS
jgi:RES domain-containing protein